ncbi:hypothetical protein IMZ48_04995 [Candidatus Bathyarchaeota archaeon]|nr:hypothetical protein [Candidatus Bathyarchaeota archaeon]
MDFELHNVSYDPASKTPTGRCLATHTKRDGTTAPLVLEWISSIPTGLTISLVQLRDELPTNSRRPEETRTLRFAGLHRERGRAALAYELPYVPATLRDVLESVPKPSTSDRCALARLVTTQVRSLHVHFRNIHMGLRTESFVFLRNPAMQEKKQNGNGNGVEIGPGDLDLRNPYLLDWGRESSPSVYQYPEFDAHKKLWYYDVWSLLIILSEIAEWKPLGSCPTDAAGLRARKKEIMRRITSDGWKGETTARLFRFGFGFLEAIRLETMSWGVIKKFFDQLCELLDTSGDAKV